LQALRQPDIPLPLVVMRQVRMQGVTLGSRADFEAMLRACTAARLRPGSG
jgi:D-arabinose 1-dehydrogenase-like Zn-dependent alcohol dehydrogenase